MRIGDTVLTPDKRTREVLVGEVVGEYRYDPSLTEEAYPQVRDVRWSGRIARDDMTPEFRASIGNISTVFTVDGYEQEILRLLTGTPTSTGEEDVEEPYDFLKETEAKAQDLIADRIAKIHWHDFERLVAAVLETLGFRTKLTRVGPDGGYDILAHPDALGFGTPRVKVEVKHRKAATSAPDVRNFRSTIRPDEKGLYVSTGGFAADALRVPDTAGLPLVLMDRDQFMDLLLENYESLDSEFQAMVPLKKVYIPSET
jgi:restriction system protein